MENDTKKPNWGGRLNVTPVSYMLDGKQYVTLLAGAYPANRLFTLVLDGKAPIPPVEKAQ